MDCVRHGAPANRADLILAACQALGVYMLTVFTVSFAVYGLLSLAVSSRPPGRYPLAMPGCAGTPALWLGCGIAGLALLCGYHAASRVRQRRHCRRGEVPGEFYPLAAAVFCVVLTGAGYVLRMIGLTLAR